VPNSDSVILAAGESHVPVAQRTFDDAFGLAQARND